MCVSVASIMFKSCGLIFAIPVLAAQVFFFFKHLIVEFNKTVISFFFLKKFSFLIFGFCLILFKFLIHRS